MENVESRGNGPKGREIMVKRLESKKFMDKEGT